MAEAQMAGDCLTKLAKDISCAVCRRQYKDPRVLSCCHYFCRECLQHLVGKDGRLGTIACPLCDESSLCVQAENLPQVRFVDGLLQLYQQLSQLEEGKDMPCGACSDSVASSFCQQCGDFICTECVSSHRKMKVKFGDHKILSVSELKSSESDILPLQSKSKTCPDHDEQCKLYCFDCDKLICRDCTIIDHSQHNFDFLKKSAARFRDAVQQKAQPLKQLSSDVKQATRKIIEMKCDIQQQHDFAQDHIRQKFSEMIERLRIREKELLAETEKSVQYKISQLETQENIITQAAKRVNTLLNFVQQNLQIAPDEGLIAAHQELEDKLESECKRQEGIQLSPVQTANIAVKIVAIDDLTTLVEDKASVYEFSDTADVHMAEVGAQTTHYVTDHHDTSHSDAGNVTATLNSTVNGATVDADVIKTGKGLYEVTYTPVIRGRHELHIAVDGQPILGKPRSVFAAIPPSQLGPLPLRTLPGFKHPFAARFDSQGHLLVTESSGRKVTRLHPEGKPLTKNGHFLELDIPSPTGLAVDSSTGDVYVASGSNNSVSKYSSEGDLLGEVECIDMDHPCGLTLVNNELFVCDRNNSRVHVFDSKLKHQRSFGSHGNKSGQLHWPYDIVRNEEGNIVVSDCDNHRLQEFTPQGRAVASFGCSKSSPGGLKRPMGLSLSRTGHMYVTEFENHCLSVFDKEGGRVCSLGKYGTGNGNMCYPTGVAIDDDGFVYVCDQGNNRVLVY